GDADQAADLLHRCGDMADGPFRENLGGNLLGVWSKPVQERIDAGKLPDALERLKKHRSLADELRNLPDWNLLAKQIENHWLAKLREDGEKNPGARPIVELRALANA